MFSIALFLLGFVLLIQGANWFVDGAASIAHRLRIPPLVIGLTIVSLGTSAPEALISATASWQNHTALALGNVFGSIITNTLLGLGLAATLAPLKVKNSTVWKEIPFLLFAITMVLVMTSDSFFDPTTTSVISKRDGLILLSFFVLFLIYTVRLARSKQENAFADTIPVHSQIKSIVLFFVGLVSLMLGSHWAVTGAVATAQHFGISESIIGLTIIAIGTSLPEITTAVIAGYKGHADMAVGNVVGANLFNALWILGMGAVIRPLIVLPIALQSAIFAAFVTLLLMIFLWTKKNRMLSRGEGITFLALYALFTVFLIYY